MEGNERFKPYNHREMSYEMDKLWKQLGLTGKECRKACDFVPNHSYLEEYEIDYGRDTLVCFDGFVGFSKGSLDEDSYEEEALDGVYNFCRRVDHLAQELVEMAEPLAAETEETYLDRQRMLENFMAPIAKKHTRPYVALLMEYCNQIQEKISGQQVSGQMVHDYLILLSAFAPIVAENSYQMLKANGKLQGGKSILTEQWPQVDADFLQNGVVEIPVQITGKTKLTMALAKNASKEEAVARAGILLAEQGILTDASMIQQYEVIYVPGKIMNFCK